jgi:CRP/FNR family transcriptional regulator
MNAEEALKSCLMFGALQKEDLERIGELVLPRKFKRGESVFSEGDRSEGFYVVQSGEVKLYKLSADGKEQVLHIVGPGENFAEATIFGDATYPAYCEALKDSILLLIPKNDILRLLKNDPELSLRMLASLSSWLKRMALLVEEVTLKDVNTRLAGFLLSTMEIKGEKVADGILVDLGMDKKTLAAKLGTVSETLSRALRKLKDNDIIKVEGRKLTVLDRDALRDIINE